MTICSSISNLIFDFGSHLTCSGFFLAMTQGSFLVIFGRPYGLVGIKPKTTACKATPLSTVLSFGPLFNLFLIAGVKPRASHMRHMLCHCATDLTLNYYYFNTSWCLYIVSLILVLQVICIYLVLKALEIVKNNHHKIIRGVMKLWTFIPPPHFA